MRAWIATACVWATLGAVAQAAPQKITNPDWLARPTARDVADYYPPVAMALLIEGMALVRCEVTAAGVLTRCSAVYESPAGLGFGLATVRMTPMFRMRPMTVDGKPVDGGEVNIPLSFKLPPKPAFKDAPAPTVPLETVASARRLLAATGFEDLMRDRVRLGEPRLIGPQTGTAETIGRDAIAAWRESVTPVAAEMTDITAAYLATRMTSQQLAQAIVFHESPAGQVIRGADYAWRPREGTETRLLSRELLSRVSEEFCGLRSCVSDLPEAAAEPQWEQRPSAREIVTGHPRVASVMGLAGVARVACHVGSDRRLTACKVVAESPTGMGFGLAAMRLAPIYRVYPETAAEVGTTSVEATLRFMGASARRPEKPAEADPTRLALTSELFGEDINHQIQAFVGSMNYSLPSPMAGEMDPATRDVIRGILSRQAIPFATLASDRVLRRYAGSIPLEFLQAGAAFKRTGADKALRALMTERPPEAWIVRMRGVAESSASRASALFCAKHDCKVAPPPPELTADTGQPAAKPSP